MKFHTINVKLVNYAIRWNETNLLQIIVGLKLCRVSKGALAQPPPHTPQNYRWFITRLQENKTS